MQAFQGNAELNEAYFGPARTRRCRRAREHRRRLRSTSSRPRLNGYGKTNHYCYRRFGKSGSAASAAALRLHGSGRRCHATALILRSTALWHLTWDEKNRRGSCSLLLRELQPVSVVHLAFVIDPQRSGVLDVDRMWRINVAGTARVMEAVSRSQPECGTTIGNSFFPAACRRMAPT